jgi:hypothetical protein
MKGAVMADNKQYDGYVCTDSIPLKDLADVRPDEKGAEDRKDVKAQKPGKR